MSEIIGHNGYVIFFGGLPIIHPTYYHVYVSETSHGTVTVNHIAGPSGTLVTISAVPDASYELDTIALTGAELINGNQFYIDDSDVYVNVTFKVNYNPLNLPPNTVRVRTRDGAAPVKAYYTSYETATLVPGTTDVYDVYKSGTSLKNLIYRSTNIVEILGANTSDVTDMWGMFYECSSLTTVPLFDTSNVTTMTNMFNSCSSLKTAPLLDTSKVTNMGNMFLFCSSLTAVPLFDTSKVTSMNEMFRYCYKVESGALALYQQASSQSNPPSNHINTFEDCGRDTETGAAELAQINANWK